MKDATHADTVVLFEVGPRDGLQNETRQIPTRKKIALIDALSDCGFAKIEVASFVSPRWVPQMADGAEVLAGIDRHPDITYAALTPNMRGFEAALAAGADEIAVFASASEGFSRANINCSIAESFIRFDPILAAARKAKIPVRGYVSCVTDCPYDGPVHPDAVETVADALIRHGCYQVSLGDTIGKGTPDRVGVMLDAVLCSVPARKLAGHFHDTDGRALENIEAALSRGIRVFDTAVGGLGGCPYAPGAAGNVATEAVMGLLDRLGYGHGLDPDRVERAARMAQALRQGG